MVPWPEAAKLKTGMFDRDLVREAILDPPPPSAVDPRCLSASQPGVTRSGVNYYLNLPTYRLTGVTYADQDNPGNQRPVVYRRPGPFGTLNIILSGHHRATAALLSGQGLIATVVEGP